MPAVVSRDYTYRALAVAVVIEIISCIGIYGDRFSHTAANGLVNLHLTINLPVYFLFYLMGIGPVVQIKNGCLGLGNPLALAAIGAQCCAWTWLLAQLMRFQGQIRERWFRKGREY